MKNDYLTRKKPWHALTIFALPIILGNLFQQTYTMADSAIVGRFVGEQALAAVGASFSLTNVFIFIAIGCGVGSGVVIGRYFGGKEFLRMKRAVYTALITFLSISILMGIFGLAFSHKIMELLNTPADVMEMAVVYLDIYFIGLPFLFMYNILSAMFNAIGKSRIPLVLLLFSSILNIGLDLLFIIKFDMGVSGAAWATLIAQGLSAILSFSIFMRVIHNLEAGKVKIYDKYELRNITQIALPSILQHSTVSIGMMLVQSIVNSFGSQALAGFSAAMRIESICVVPMLGIGTALASFTAQNIGAGQIGRVKEGYKVANQMVLISALLILVVLELFNYPIIAFFLGDAGTDVAYATGTGYLIFVGFFFAILGWKMAVDAILQGSGDMKMFTIANLANLSIRVIIPLFFAHKVGIQIVWYAIPIGWFANWLISYCQYRTGKWKRIYVKTA